MKIKEEYYDVNGISLHLLEAGDPEAELMVFLHGFPENCWSWQNQITYFAEQGYRVVAPDQRGYNRSSKPKGISSYKIDYLTEDIACLIRQIGGRPAVLVGHDWGGAVAWAFAMRFPQLLSKLVILNMPYPRVMKESFAHWPKQLLKSWYIGYFQLPKLPELSLKLFNFKMLQRSLISTSRKGTFPDHVLSQYRDAWREPGALTAMINWYRALRYQSEPAQQQQLKLPTLLIWGKEDSFLSHEMAQASIDWCSEGTLVMIDNATHWVHHEETERVNQLIHNFIVGK